MAKQFHKAGVGLVKGAGTILAEFILSLLLLGTAAVLLMSGYQLLAMYITPLGMLVGFCCVVPTTYIFVRLTQGENNTYD